MNTDYMHPKFYRACTGGIWPLPWPYNWHDWDHTYCMGGEL